MHGQVVVRLHEERAMLCGNEIDRWPKSIWLINRGGKSDDRCGESLRLPAHHLIGHIEKL
jgi:hypothetical protein